MIFFIKKILLSLKRGYNIWMIITKQIKKRNKELEVSPKLTNHLKRKNGRPLEFTEQIGDFILMYLSLGYTMDNICTKFNKITGDDFLNRMKIYNWINNKNLKKFKMQVLRARELAAFTVLDDIMDKEKDIENLTLDSKAGRVILESLRWRSKIQNPDYFNPVNKNTLSADHTFKIITQMPDPAPLNQDDIMEGELLPE